MYTAHERHLVDSFSHCCCRAGIALSYAKKTQNTDRIRTTRSLNCDIFSIIVLLSHLQTSVIPHNELLLLLLLLLNWSDTERNWILTINILYFFITASWILLFLLPCPLPPVFLTLHYVIRTRALVDRGVFLVMQLSSSRSMPLLDGLLSSACDQVVFTHSK